MESEGLVAERARRMLAERGIATVWVDRAELFHEVRSRLDFDLIAVGARSPKEIEGLELAGLDPLILLIPSHSAWAAHYRIALPGATLVDRGLRDPDALVGALDSALGEPSEASLPAADVVRRAFEPFQLSERQLEVLSSALLGDSSAEIAGKLYISQMTVRNHLHAIYERVGVSGRRELLGRFVRGLVEEGHA